MRAKAPQTSTVVIHPRVLATLTYWQAVATGRETGGLLIGRATGSKLYVEHATRSRRNGEATTIQLDANDYERARRLCRKKQSTVGWWHGHPTFGVFLSGLDVRHTHQGQQLFADFVAVVVDPFTKDGVGLGCFRVEHGKGMILPHRIGARK